MYVYVSVSVFENLFFLEGHVRLSCDNVKAWVTCSVVNVRVCACIFRSVLSGGHHDWCRWVATLDIVIVIMLSA